VVVARRDVTVLSEYQQEMAERNAPGRLYTNEVIAGWPKCCTCGKPMHPDLMVDQAGNRCDSHPGCDLVSTQRREAA
jgi:hypothetical protein